MGRIKIYVVIAILAAVIFPKNVLSQRHLSVGGWIPYWAKQEGSQKVLAHVNFFTEISPFSLTVDDQGKLLDSAKIDQQPWISLFEQLSRKGVKIIPSILWNNAVAIHGVLSDAHLRKQHIDGIVAFIQKGHFDGIDIDYEGKNVDDKNVFSTFLSGLSLRLKQNKVKLICTIEARNGINNTERKGLLEAMALANDYKVLNEVCDSVRIMAYDQWLSQDQWATPGEPYAPLADIRWVQSVIHYAAHEIDRSKIFLGIPTYGREFIIKGSGNKPSYERLRSINYQDMIQLAKSLPLTPQRTSSGELTLVYEEKGKRKIISISDAEAIRQKIQLAIHEHLGGIIFFKMDGLEDPALWDVLNAELNKTDVRN